MWQQWSVCALPGRFSTNPVIISPRDFPGGGGESKHDLKKTPKQVQKDASNKDQKNLPLVAG